jgi:S1-C subfamily serine protease
VNGLTLDVILLLILAGHALHGYRRGFLLTVTETVGFLAGAGLAVTMLPSRIEQFTPDTMAPFRPVLVVVAVLVLATVGQFLAVRITRPVLGGRQPGPLRHIDRALGGVVTTGVAALVVWFVAGLIQTASPTWMKATIAQSRVLQAVDSVMPSTSDRVLAQVIMTLTDYGFPRAFAGLAQEPITPVDPPDTRVATSAGVAAAKASIVRVDASALRCAGRDRTFEGTGWVAAERTVVTNAHVVAGAENVTVRTSRGKKRATVIAFDPVRDLAVLYVRDLDVPMLRQGTPLRPGASAVVAGFPLNGPYRLDAARVRGIITARGLDIYSTGQVERQIYSLRASIHPGNSGGPLLDGSGKVVGVVFARSVEDSATAYALTLDELRPVLESARPGQAVGTGGQCATT